MHLVYPERLRLAYSRANWKGRYPISTPTVGISSAINQNFNGATDEVDENNSARIRLEPRDDTGWVMGSKSDPRKQM